MAIGGDVCGDGGEGWFLGIAATAVGDFNGPREVTSAAARAPTPSSIVWPRSPIYCR